MADQLRSTVSDVEDLAAEAVPLTSTSPFGDVKLPPAALVDELDNADATPAAPEERADEPVTLDFFGDDLPFITHKLKHPFRWQDVRVEAVEVHQMSTADVGRALREQDAGREVDLYDLFGRMTRVVGRDDVRLTPAVLRQMPHVDGGPIVKAAFDFLPPFFRPEGV